MDIKVEEETDNTPILESIDHAIKRLGKNASFDLLFAEASRNLAASQKV